jgi:hypothetical protein
MTDKMQAKDTTAAKERWKDKKELWSPQVGGRMCRGGGGWGHETPK